MLPRVDSASQNQGSGKPDAWMQSKPALRFSVAPSATSTLSSEALVRSTSVMTPNSPTILANWPSSKRHIAPKAVLSKQPEVQSEPPSLPETEAPLILLTGDTSFTSDVADPVKSSTLVTASSTSGKPLTRSDSGDSISKILYDSPLEAFSGSPVEAAHGDSGNPFAQPDAASRPPPTAFRAPELRSQASMPVHSFSSPFYSVHDSGLLRSTQSTDLASHHSMGNGGLSGSVKAPLSPSWIAPPSSHVPAPARSLSSAQSILGRTWSATAANIDPCSEVLVNTFAEFSKDMIPAPVQRTPMKRQGSTSSQRSIQSFK